MSDGDEPSQPVEAPVEPTPSRWQLPEGIEDHLESGLIKTTSGALVGGLLGLALFKAGGGWRSASIAAGVGVGLGSTYQRAKAGPKLAE